MKDTLKQLIQISILFIKNHWRILSLLGCFLILGTIFFCIVVIPSFVKHGNGMYGSKLGYPSLLRKLGRPIPVKVAQPKEQEFEQKILAEGICASEPYLVPVIPMSTITKVLVKEGNFIRKGEVMARLDTSKADIKLEAAELALNNAKAEYERVRLGSAYVLAQERPQIEALNFENLKSQLNLQEEKLNKFKKAQARGALSQIALMQAQSEYDEALKKFKQSEIMLNMSQAGIVESLKIAENTIEEMTQAVKHRKEELKDYEILAPTDGMIERILIREGEYNQDTGKPGFIIASGKWFEAHFDQNDFEKLQVNTPATIFLEAFPGDVIQGTIKEILPVISFNQGGPEITRPLRPRGTGSPEWAATFRAKISLPAEAEKSIAIGMTGFCSVSIKTKNLSLPKSAVHAISAGRGLVDIPTNDGSWKSIPVRIGIYDDQNIEILEGLDAQQTVIVNGHWVLSPKDKIDYDD